MDRLKGALLVLGGLVALALLYGLSQLRCWSAWSQWDIDVEACPAGTPLLQADLQADGLRRGESAWIVVRAAMVYPWPWAPWTDGEGLARAPLLDFEPALELVAPDGSSRPLDCRWSEVQDDGQAACTTELPEDIPDGQSLIRATVRTDHSPELVVEAEAGFYRPSRVHVLTDRPLYEPGDLVQFRALVLGEDGQGPLGERPGRWQIYDPQGELVHEARGSTGPHGIADSDLPLASDAPHGAWRVVWSTGADSGTATVEVRPFTLPRAELELRASQRWFSPGEEVLLEGELRTLSGVPLADRPVDITLSESSSWPPPLSWAAVEPVQTDAAGRFRVVLEAIPDDLRQRVVLPVLATAITDSGERIAGATRLVLSPDELHVEALTELGDGLVPDLSNRVYLKVMTPDGSPLPEVDVDLRNQWEARDLGRTVRTDEDGVLSVNLDPGQPVQVLVPPAPVRTPPPPPRSPTLSLRELEAFTPRDRLAGRALEEALEVAEARCNFRIRTRGTKIFAIEARGGRISSVTPAHQPDRACIARALTGRALPDGVYQATLGLEPASYLPRLEASLSFLGDGSLWSVEEAVAAAALEAEACVQGRTEGGGQSPFLLHWRAREGQRTLGAQVLRRSEGEPWPEQACIAATFRRLELPRRVADDPASGLPEHDLQGIVTFALSVPEAPRPPAAPRATTTTAFEYRVAVEGLGETTWRSAPGAAPPLRLRPEAVLLEPDQAFSVATLRGPGFEGELPGEIVLSQGRETWTCPRTPELLDEERHEGCPAPQEGKDFHLQAPAEGGFLELSAGGARAVVYVRPAARHSLALSTVEPSYAPGETATVQVRTGQPAVVSLTGVDEAMSQLTTLPSPDALAELVLDVDMEAAVLGGFDALALSTGRIRGDNAAMATLQRVQLAPASQREELPVSARAAVAPQVDVERAAAFAQLLAAVRRRISATEGPVDYETYAATWDAAAADRLDPFGLPMTLEQLPEELLSLADPRLVVVDATRLPEDLEPWSGWVRRTRS